MLLLRSVNIFNIINEKGTMHIFTQCYPEECTNLMNTFYWSKIWIYFVFTVFVFNSLSSIMFQSSSSYVFSFGLIYF